MADNNFFDRFKNIKAPEGVGTTGGAATGWGIGWVIDAHLGPLLAGSVIIQDLVWLCAPPIGFVIGGVAGYKIVKRLTKENDDNNPPPRGNASK